MSLRNFHEPKPNIPQPPIDVRSITAPEQAQVKEATPRFDVEKYISPEVLAGMIAVWQELEPEEMVHRMQEARAFIILAPEAGIAETFNAVVPWSEVIDYLGLPPQISDGDDSNTFYIRLERMAWINPLMTRKYLEHNWDKLDPWMEMHDHSFLLALKIAWPEKFQSLKRKEALEHFIGTLNQIKENDKDFVPLKYTLTLYAYLRLLWPEKMQQVDPLIADQQTFEKYLEHLKKLYQQRSSLDGGDKLLNLCANLNLLNYDDIGVIDGKVRLIKKAETAKLDVDIPPRPAEKEI